MNLKSITVLFISTFSILLYLSSSLLAQTENKHIREGNKEFDNKNYTNAQVNYTTAINQNPLSFVANYNLGNTEFAQKKYEEAIKQYSNSSEQNVSAEYLAKSNYNLGNTYMQQQKFKEAVAAYKKSLKYKPNDADAKYNLSYAQKKLKENPQDQENKNKNQDKSEEDKNQENKENQNKQENENNKKEAQNQQISKQDAERILKAIEEGDKKVQQKLAKQKGKSTKKKLEKDW
ncbi:MAG: tetratricopeptide repeat protein [Bacteroidales bacterium]|nr:tetratricopeptide repeat protein [Bacteroidales bacterium]